MRVLLVTYYFPPAGGGGVQRVLGWCRHLPEHGVDVTVIAPREPHWVDQDTTLVIPADTHVIRTPDPSPAAVIPRAAIAEVRGVRRALRRLALQPRRVRVPDIHRPWRRPAVAAALAGVGEHPGTRPFDVVVSSSPPETTHLVARDLARAFGVPWVADYRDSWLDLPHLRMTSVLVRAKHRRNVRLATRLMRDAAAAVTVSEPLAADLRRRHPGLDVVVIENGIQLDAVARAAPRAAGYQDAGRFVATYTGNFFGRQSATSLLAAIESALEREPGLASDLLVRFIGGLKPDEARRLGALVDRGVAEHVGFLRHDDVLAHQRASDLLLLYVAAGAGSAGVYTGKVFEYVAARRPVLALVPAANVAAALLERSGSTCDGGGARVDPDDVEAITVALLDAWRQWHAAGGQAGGQVADIPVPDDLLASLDRADGAGRLAELLRRVTP